MYAVPDHQPWLAPECGHDVYAAAIALGPEGDPGAVRRERGLVIVRLVACQPYRLPAVHGLNPDVEVAFAAAVGCISDERRIRRQRRIRCQAGIGSHSFQDQERACRRCSA